MANQSIGFIGLGQMGVPMVRNLLRAGHLVHGFDLNPAAAKTFSDEKGFSPAKSPQQAALAGDVVILMLPDSNVVDKLLWIDEGGLVASLPLVSFLTMLWLWHDGSGDRIADLALSSTAYVIASLPAFIVLALALRRGLALPFAMALFVACGFAGYLVMIALGKRLGLPV